jgi:peptide/nickel transport system substrate-binding protein
MIHSRIRNLLAGAMLVCMAPLAHAATPADTLMIGQTIDDVVSFDPAEVFEFTGGEVSNNVYLRLISRDEADQAKLVGGAAESWTISDDGLTLTFKMRPGLVFASGDPVTAEDAAFSLQRVIKLAKSPAFILTQFGWTADNVEKMVTAPDAGTLILKISEPLAPSLVLNALSAGVGAVVEKKIAMENEKDGDLGHDYLRSHSAGAGAFILRDWKPNEVVVLDANDKYFQGAPTMKHIILRHVPEATTQRLMLEKGDIDIARNLAADQLDALAGNSEFKIDIQPKSTVLYLGMNTTMPELADPKVEEALRWLVNYDQIAESLLKRQYKAHQSVLSSGSFAALDEMPYHFDPDKAKQLLAESGHGDGMKLSIDVFAASPYRDIAEAMQADFAKAGVTLDIIAGDRKQTLTKYRARNHQLVMMVWSPDYGDPHSTIDFFVNNPDNSPESKIKTAAWRNGWQSKEMMDLSNVAVHERDTDKRIPAYLDIQRKLQHESPMAVMFQQTEAVAMSAKINGWISGPAFDTYIYRGITK